MQFRGGDVVSIEGVVDVVTDEYLFITANGRPHAVHKRSANLVVAPAGNRSEPILAGDDYTARVG